MMYVLSAAVPFIFQFLIAMAITSVALLNCCSGAKNSKDNSKPGRSKCNPKKDTPKTAAKRTKTVTETINNLSDTTHQPAPSQAAMKRTMTKSTETTDMPNTLVTGNELQNTQGTATTAF